MNKKIVVLLDIDYTIFDTKTFKDSTLTIFSLYEEVFPVLKKLKNIASLGIFSKGNVEFQNIKLKQTGIIDFFDQANVHVFEDKEININIVLDKYKDYKVFLVDDKLGVLYTAKAHSTSIFTIWVRRGPFAQNQTQLENFLPDVEIENLSLLDKIILQNS